MYQIDVAMFLALPLCLLCRKTVVSPQLGCPTPAPNPADGSSAIHARFSLSLPPTALPLFSPSALGSAVWRLLWK